MHTQRITVDGAHDKKVTVASNPRVLAPIPWPNLWLRVKISFHHNIHQLRLARAKLNLPTHTIKPRSTATKLTNYLNKTNANNNR